MENIKKMCVKVNYGEKENKRSKNIFFLNTKNNTPHNLIIWQYGCGDQFK